MRCSTESSVSTSSSFTVFKIWDAWALSRLNLLLLILAQVSHSLMMEWHTKYGVYWKCSGLLQDEGIFYHSNCLELLDTVAIKKQTDFSGFYYFYKYVIDNALLSCFQERLCSPHPTGEPNALKHVFPEFLLCINLHNLPVSSSWKWDYTIYIKQWIVNAFQVNKCRPTSFILICSIWLCLIPFGQVCRSFSVSQYCQLSFSNSLVFATSYTYLMSSLKYVTRNRITIPKGMHIFDIYSSTALQKVYEISSTIRQLGEAVLPFLNPRQSIKWKISHFLILFCISLISNKILYYFTNFFF